MQRRLAGYWGHESVVIDLRANPPGLPVAPDSEYLIYHIRFVRPQKLIAGGLVSLQPIERPSLNAVEHCAKPR